MQDYLVWEAPEGALSVLVRRSVLEHLKLFAEEAFSGAGAETGGVLMGRSEDLIELGRHVITIEDFENGESRLHDGVVGFARFRRQKTLHLNESDFLALRAGLGLVSLMVRPDGKGGAVGGFFYREGRRFDARRRGCIFRLMAERPTVAGWCVPLPRTRGEEVGSRKSE